MKYRKKPVVIEAVQFTGENPAEIVAFAGSAAHDIYQLGEGRCSLVIHTLEGEMKASAGDYIIKGINGEFYPCKPDVFEKTYEVAE